MAAPVTVKHNRKLGKLGSWVEKEGKGKRGGMFMWCGFTAGTCR